MITKDSIIAEVLTQCPQSALIMLEHGLSCIGCQISAYESIEQGCLAHGFGEKEVSKIVNELNKACKQENVRLITVTKKACLKLSEIFESNGKKGFGVRLNAITSADGRTSYQMAFEKTPLQTDLVLDFDGLKVFFEKKLQNTLAGTVIDYSSKGFKIFKPSGKN